MRHITPFFMPNLNKVLLMGNLTADPEIRYTPKGTAVTDIRLAINRYISGAAESGDRQEETTFVDVTLWNRQAEITANYLTKGSGVFIEGRLQLDSWEDKQTGQKRTKLRVIGENVQFLPKGGGGNDGSSSARPPQQQRPPGNFQGGQQRSNQGYTRPPAETTPPPPSNTFEEDDDIPF